MKNALEVYTSLTEHLVRLDNEIRMLRRQKETVEVQLNSLIQTRNDFLTSRLGILEFLRSLREETKK